MSKCRVISETEMMKLKSLVTINYYVMANYYNNFAHTAHHIRKVYTLIKANTFSFLCQLRQIKIFLNKKRRAWLVYRLFELSWHKVLVEESVGKIMFYSLTW